MIRVRAKDAVGMTQIMTHMKHKVRHCHLSPPEDVIKQIPSCLSNVWAKKMKKWEKARRVNNPNLHGLLVRKLNAESLLDCRLWILKNGSTTVRVACVRVQMTNLMTFLHAQQLLHQLKHKLFT